MADFDFGLQIGSGGGGIVKEAIRISDDWLCAAKFINVTHSAEDFDRFKRAIRMLSNLDEFNISGPSISPDHAMKIILTRHVVPIVAMNFSSKPPWYIMPRASFSFHDLLNRASQDAASLKQRLALFEETALGVAFAHDRGIIHRDIKPKNSLLFASGESIHAAISDFEIGRFQLRDTPTITPYKEALGTYSFAAPEQLTNAKDVDLRADIYSLGKMLYEIITLRPPDPFDLTRVPDVYRPVIAKATRRRPGQRYQTVAEMLGALSQVVNEGASTA